MLHLYWASCHELEGDSQPERLSLRERGELLQFDSSRRKRDWLIGRLAAKGVLQQFLHDRGYLSVQPNEIEIYSTDGAPAVQVNGKRVDGISLSIAHSHGHALAGAAHITTDGQIGVDLERIRPVHPKLASRMLTPKEREQLRHVRADMYHERLILYWVLKEAAIKALKPLLGNLWMNQLEAEFDKRRERARILFLPLDSEKITVETQYEEQHGFLGACALVTPDVITLISRQ